MNLDILSGGSDLGLSSYNNRACKLLFCTLKLVPAKKRKKTETNDDRDQGNSNQKSSQ